MFLSSNLTGLKSTNMLGFALLFMAWLFFAGTVRAQDDFEFDKEIDELVQPFLENQKFQGVSIGIIHKGQVITRNYGRLSADDPRLPKADTIYEIGSISKVFTGLLLADAVARKQVQLDQTIGTFIEGLEDSNEEVANSVTLVQLSQHMSGLPRMPLNLRPADPNDPFRGYDRKLLFEFLKHARLINKPGEKHLYSNLGVGLLGDLLAKRAGESYETLLRERVLEPLKMSDTSLEVSPDRQKRFAPPHNAALVKDHPWGFDALAGAGGIRSTVNDMVRFMQANLDPPKGPVGAAIESAWTQRLDAGGGHRAMGLGWMIAGDGSTRWHNGMTGGYQSMMLVSRDLKLGVVLLCNTAGAEVDGLAEGIFQRLAGMKVKPKKFDAVVKVNPETVQRLVGRYRLAPKMVITVKANGSRLSVQLTGQGALAVFPESDTVWNYRGVPAQLVFELPPDSPNAPATKVTLLQNGLKMASPRIVGE